MSISETEFTALPPKRMIELFETADLIEGSGAYWVMSACRGLVIQRRERDANALSLLASWRSTGCGLRGCRGHHAVFACEEPIEEYQERLAHEAGTRPYRRKARVESAAARGAPPACYLVPSIFLHSTMALTNVYGLYERAGANMVPIVKVPLAYVGA